MSQIRTKAKLNGLMALKGSWIKAIIALSIIALLNFGISKLDDAYRLFFNIPILTANELLNTNMMSFIIEAVFTVISFFVMVPLVFGMFEWYWNLTGSKHSGIGDVFAWYGSLKLYVKSLLLYLDVFVRCLLWAILTCGLPVALIAFSYYSISGINLQSAVLTPNQIQTILISGFILLAGLVLFIGGFLLLLYITTRYILAFFLILEDNTRKVNAVVKDSIKFSRKYRWEITKFYLSYIGWALLCVALLPVLYVVPYFCSSLTILAKHIIYSERKHENNDDTKSYKVVLDKS